MADAIAVDAEGEAAAIRGRIGARPGRRRRGHRDGSAVGDAVVAGTGVDARRPQRAAALAFHPAVAEEGTGAGVIVRARVDGGADVQLAAVVDDVRAGAAIDAGGDGFGDGLAGGRGTA